MVGLGLGDKIPILDEKSIGQVQKRREIIFDGQILWVVKGTETGISQVCLHVRMIYQSRKFSFTLWIRLLLTEYYETDYFFLEKLMLKVFIFDQ